MCGNSLAHMGRTSAVRACPVCASDRGPIPKFRHRTKRPQPSFVLSLDGQAISSRWIIMRFNDLAAKESTDASERPGRDVADEGSKSTRRGGCLSQPSVSLVLLFETPPSPNDHPLHRCHLSLSLPRVPHLLSVRSLSALPTVRADLPSVCCRCVARACLLAVAEGGGKKASSPRPPLSHILAPAPPASQGGLHE